MHYTKKAFAELLDAFIEDNTTTFAQRTKAIALREELRHRDTGHPPAPQAAGEPEGNPPEGSGN